MLFVLFTEYLSEKRVWCWAKDEEGRELEVSGVNCGTSQHLQSLVFFICKMEVVVSVQRGNCTYQSRQHI